VREECDGGQTGTIFILFLDGCGNIFTYHINLEFHSETQIRHLDR
jgi:hypothetical protein